MINKTPYCKNKNDLVTFKALKNKKSLIEYIFINGVKVFNFKLFCSILASIACPNKTKIKIKYDSTFRSYKEIIITATKATITPYKKVTSKSDINKLLGVKLFWKIAYL